MEAPEEDPWLTRSAFNYDYVEHGHSTSIKSCPSWQLRPHDVERVAGRYLDWSQYQGEPPGIIRVTLETAVNNTRNHCGFALTGYEYAAATVEAVKREWQRQFPGEEPPWPGDSVPVLYQGIEHFVTTVFVLTHPPYPDLPPEYRSTKYYGTFELDFSVLGLNHVTFHEAYARPPSQWFEWGSSKYLTAIVVEARWTCEVDPCPLTWTIKDPEGTTIYEETSESPFYYEWPHEAEEVPDEMWSVTARGELTVFAEGDLLITMFEAGEVPDGYSAFKE